MLPIKVLQVFTILNRGGAETNLMNYYRQIDRNKFQFDFLVHREEIGAYEEEIEQLGGRIFRLPAIHPLHIKEYRAAVIKFFNDNPGYQIIHGQCSELGIFIYQEAKKRKIPVIIAHAHNSKMDWDQKAIFRILWKHKMRKYINAYFTCGAEAAVWLFGKKLATKVYQMNNAIATDNFRFNPEVRKMQQKQLQAEKSFNLFHVGRFNVQKNHAFVIKIFAEVVKLRPESHLYLVGEGELKTEISEQVKALNLSSRITFMGLRDDIAEIFQAMDVFLFPSLFEGLPVALVEAQASGISCVISSAIPQEAILIPENVSVLSLHESPLLWAEKIITINTSHRKDMSGIIAKIGYDIAANVKKLETKYVDLLMDNLPVNN